MSLHQTDIGTIETLQWGEGRERILLLHCAGSGPHSLTTLAKSLCSAERMVIVPALNRYGHTDVNPTDAIKEHVSVVNWVLNHYAQEADSVSLFGHSMGGLIALLVIAQTQTRCDHVVVYDPIVPNVLDGADQRDCDALAWDRDIVMTLHDAVANGDYERGCLVLLKPGTRPHGESYLSLCAANSYARHHVWHERSTPSRTMTPRVWTVTGGIRSIADKLNVRPLERIDAK